MLGSTYFMTYALPIVIIFGAFLGQAIFGFGGGLLSIPLLSLILPIQDAICLALIFQLLMGFLLLRIWRETPWLTLRPLGFGLVCGTLLGVSFLAYASETFLRLFLLIFIVLFLVRARLFKDRQFPGITTPFWASVTGVMGGFLQGVLGTGGPIFVIYLNEAANDKTQFRAAVIFILFGCNLIRILLAAPTGLLSPSVLELSMMALPAFLLALFLGQKLHVKFSSERFRSCVEVLLFISAISLGVKLLI